MAASWLIISLISAVGCTSKDIHDYSDAPADGDLDVVGKHQNAATEKDLDELVKQQKLSPLLQKDVSFQQKFDDAQAAAIPPEQDKPARKLTPPPKQEQLPAHVLRREPPVNARKSQIPYVDANDADLLKPRVPEDSKSTLKKPSFNVEEAAASLAHSTAAIANSEKVLADTLKKVVQRHSAERAAENARTLLAAQHPDASAASGSAAEWNDHLKPPGPGPPMVVVGEGGTKGNEWRKGPPGQHWEQGGQGAAANGEFHMANGTWTWADPKKGPVNSLCTWTWIKDVTGGFKYRCLRPPHPQWQWVNRGRRYEWASHHRRRTSFKYVAPLVVRKDSVGGYLGDAGSGGNAGFDVGALTAAVANSQDDPVSSPGYQRSAHSVSQAIDKEEDDEDEDGDDAAETQQEEAEEAEPDASWLKYASQKASWHNGGAVYW